MRGVVQSAVQQTEATANAHVQQAIQSAHQSAVQRTVQGMQSEMQEKLLQQQVRLDNILQQRKACVSVRASWCARACVWVYQSVRISSVSGEKPEAGAHLRAPQKCMALSTSSAHEHLQKQAQMP